MRSFFILLSFLGFTSCSNNQIDSDRGTPVSGAFTIYCDETYFSLVKVLTEGYMSVYPQTVISIDTTFSTNAFSKLADSSIHSVITGFPLSSSDSLALNQRKIFPNVYHFATDAVALVSKNTGDSAATYTFKLTNGKCLKDLVHPLCNRFITNRAGSENNMQLQQKLASNDSCSNNWFSAGSQNDILKRVSEFENEIGIIGWSILAEKESRHVIKWRTMLNVIPFENDSQKLIYPTQSALMTGEYPLARKLYLATSEPYSGPATGFAAYVASDEGQRIIRLFGLAPYKTPPREIFVN